jgi:hypothetical protein
MAYAVRKHRDFDELPRFQHRAQAVEPVPVRNQGQAR